ncbi:PLDc N-terminal domain-containing protein [Agrococcus sp. Marseille-P2731]|uniref:PLDc N-terminal domain-containing protein n=1 Tax=Agrococcus sp. Marseille-P2731 TaxID=1841862 RepID=UPI000930AA20|nr:PLDc N-terminal domain-containing protein [Agrococcus sp. Marseille-P2731]
MIALAQAANPLLPAAYDVVWSLVVIVVVALAAAALWQILRARDLSGTQVLLWVLIVIVAPVVGALGWFALGRPRRRANPSA